MGILSEPRPLARKIVCGCCGSIFRKARINEKTYWVCRNHFRNKDNCSILQIPESEVYAAFLRIYHRLRMDGIPVLEQLAANCPKQTRSPENSEKPRHRRNASCRRIRTGPWSRPGNCWRRWLPCRNSSPSLTRPSFRTWWSGSS